jgi:hypothetical protein
MEPEETTVSWQRFGQHVSSATSPRLSTQEHKTLCFFVVSFVSDIQLVACRRRAINYSQNFWFVVMQNKSRRIRWKLHLSTVGEIRKSNKLLI